MEDIDSIDPDPALPPPLSPSHPPARLLSLALLPGFKCFFRKSVEQERIPIDECYELVLRSHFKLEQLRWPAERIVGAGGLSAEERRVKLVTHSGQQERLYLQSRKDALYKNTYCQGMEEKLKQLQMQVELYRRRSEEALEAKREQFKKATQQQEELLRKAEEERGRRARVIREVEASLGAARE